MSRFCSGKTDLMYLWNTPVVYHCHHFNLFLDQTIEDTLGPQKSYELRSNVAYRAWYQLLADAISNSDVSTPIEKLTLAKTIFKNMGHGKINLFWETNKGEAIGEFLHYGYSWKQKYGEFVKRFHPADPVAAGFARAAIEVSFNLPTFSLTTDETQCIAIDSEQCYFTIDLQSSPKDEYPLVDREYCENLEMLYRPGKYEEKVREVAKALKEFTAGVKGDERGLVEAFGVYVTMHLSNYYNGITYETLKYLEENKPFLTKPFANLAKESGHVCVFNTFGGILTSAEWESLYGKPSNDPELLISYLTGIARALGFGKWVIKDFEPNKLLVLRTYINYEAPYYLARFGHCKEPNNFFVRGASQAFMVLIDKLDWESEITLNDELYRKLFKEGIGWKVEETKSICTGSAYTEVVVTRE